MKAISLLYWKAIYRKGVISNKYKYCILKNKAYYNEKNAGVLYFDQVNACTVNNETTDTFRIDIDNAKKKCESESLCIEWIMKIGKEIEPNSPEKKKGPSTDLPKRDPLFYKVFCCSHKTKMFRRTTMMNKIQR
jgi:hypothetical protein